MAEPVSCFHRQCHGIVRLPCCSTAEASLSSLLPLVKVLLGTERIVFMEARQGILVGGWKDVGVRGTREWEIYLWGGRGAPAEYS